MSTQNVNVARFARNLEWDFFCDFQIPWNVRILHILVVLCGWLKGIMVSLVVLKVVPGTPWCGNFINAVFFFTRSRFWRAGSSSLGRAKVLLQFSKNVFSAQQFPVTWKEKDKWWPSCRRFTHSSLLLWWSTLTQLFFSLALPNFHGIKEDGWPLSWKMF